MSSSRNAPVPIDCSDGGDVVSLTVADGGPRIPVADRKHVFDRLGRAAASDSHGGFGVGLWLCRRIAIALGGTLELEGAPDQGAILRITLPKRGPATAGAESVSAAAAAVVAVAALGA